MPPALDKRTQLALSWFSSARGIGFVPHKSSPPRHRGCRTTPGGSRRTAGPTVRRTERMENRRRHGFTRMNMDSRHATTRIDLWGLGVSVVKSHRQPHRYYDYRRFTSPVCFTKIKIRTGISPPRGEDASIPRQTDGGGKGGHSTSSRQDRRDPCACGWNPLPIGATLVAWASRP